MRSRELAKLMGIGDRQYRDFRATLKQLQSEGKLVRLKRGRWAPPDPLNLVVGTVSVRRGGHLFVRVEGRDDITSEVFIRPRERLNALAGDRVMVRLHTEKDGPSPEGAIIRVLERGTAPIVGIYRQAKYFSYVVPDPPHPLREIHIPDKANKNAKVGQQVVVQIVDWEHPEQTPSGKIIKVLGYPDDPGVDMERIIAAYQIGTRFPKRVNDEVRAFPEKLSAKEIAEREDLRSLELFTIDPADAKDHDDACSLERVGNHWRLGVHIADVSYYVRPNTELDREAYDRGTSVYLVDRVIPMLPVRLSNNLCSLKPNVDRPAVSCMIDLSESGEILSYRFVRSMIHSQARLSYDEVSEYFYQGKASRGVKPHTRTLDQMRELSQILRRKRFRNGSLDLEAPEAKIQLDDEGRPVKITMRHSDHSHQLVEEFMLIANQCAAHMFLKKNLPCLYRVHGQPEQEKMEELASFMETMGYKFTAKGGVTSKKLARLLDKTKDDPRKEMIHMIVLRSLMKAVYQPENIGHFGLAFPHYVHFTSPIRRYPDLWIHRHIVKILNNNWPTSEQHKDRAALPAIGKKLSDLERAAEQAERESVRIKQLEYLSDHLGDEFEGHISGFLEFGFFVTLKGIGADGLVRFSGIDDDYYVWNRENWTVRGRRSGRQFKLGDKVNVRLIRTDPEKMEIDLVLSEAYEPRPRKGRRR
ncbi:MAG: ribonuclease R [Candidatus Zixiibacteriota bacterium]